MFGTLSVRALSVYASILWIVGSTLLAVATACSLSVPVTLLCICSNAAVHMIVAVVPFAMLAVICGSFVPAGTCCSVAFTRLVPGLGDFPPCYLAF